MPIEFKIQPISLDQNINLIPLDNSHLPELESAMDDPDIWKNHSYTDQWKDEKRSSWLKNALKAGNTYVIQKNGVCVGSSRYYDQESNSIAIGYSFLTKDQWGTGTNRIVKQALVKFALTHFEQVLFKIDQNNLQSIRAVEKIGATFVKMIENDKVRTDGSSRNTMVYSLTQPF